MFAVGKEDRPAVSGVLADFEFCEAGGSPAGSADLPQSVAVIGLINDDVVLIPGAAAGVGGVGECCNRAARSGNFLQVTIGKKSDELAVVGPERKRSAFGAIEFSGGGLIEK